MEKVKIDDDLTYRIIGCAMKVHSVLGSGFQEVIYQRAMAIEMRKAGIDFVREFVMHIYYDGEEVGTRRVDFLVENSVSVELKAVSILDDLNLCQGLNYLEAYHLAKGLLVNFGGKSLEVKRLLNRKLKSKESP